MAKAIPEAFIEQVRQKTNIVDIIEPYVQLKKAGRNLFGLCPFHEERTPSFSVSEEKQIFHCFSCGRGGNVYKFIMEIESLTFPEAVIKVASSIGMDFPVEYQAVNSNKNNSQATQLKNDYQTVTELYNHILLKTVVGEKALKYLQKRHVSAETIAHFQIGYAPAANDTVVQFLQTSNRSGQEIISSGLFAENDQGEIFDRFRDRLMFPVTDQSGNVVAFSGRVLQTDDQVAMAKYLNSPETPIFNKSKTLFNLAAAKKDIRQQGEVILFEGFMDVISAYQAGVLNGVASMGTSLTDEQLYLLNRITQRIVICYDGDQPGIKAAQRALKLLKNKNFEVAIVVIPDGQDPDEFIKAQGSAAFVKLVRQKTLSPTAFMIEYLSRQFDLTNDAAKVDFLNSALEYIGANDSPVEQELYVKQLAQRLNISVTAIQQELQDKVRSQKILQPAADFGSAKSQQSVALDHEITYSQLSSTEKSERNLLNIVFHFPEVISILDEHAGFNFAHRPYQEIFDHWVRYTLIESHPLIAQFLDLIPDDLRNLVISIEMLPRPATYTSEEINDYIANIMLDQKYQKLKQYQSQIKQAAQIGDDQKELQLTMELIKLRRELDQSKTG
ncbi:DNA primase [Bombilactobacillus thymidiniphilus]|uniref:DNA primase n=1 Tax=Bombilactobacillus thymidiniphilus TaxID=2923363 RepID=A0ABY4PE48_9LACO|nr:DNA primase [Bombilactobacillus thymidiniphilus]UQS83547.1 DNA primase [Bombilactobacillus thymidiniphilus]